jgi:hypothetical protein
MVLSHPKEDLRVEAATSSSASSRRLLFIVASLVFYVVSGERSERMRCDMIIV